MPSTRSAQLPRAVRNQDRRPVASRAPAFEHGEPIHAWQAEIEDDRTVILGIAAEPCFLAVARCLNQIASGFEGAHNIGRDPPVIFDELHPHYFS
jgi:hypothetical protein